MAETKLMKGNEALAEAAILAGCRHFFGYPITPQTEIGAYFAKRMPQVGDRLSFGDMAIYSIVKTNTFNGMPLPAIALQRESGDCELVKRFDYADFKGRLS